jgi:1,2-phenylacetyl-CoA epoxidase PaaB subunit
VQSHAVKIEAPDWETALFLPVENFAKKAKTKVWAISETKIAGSSRTVNEAYEEDNEE